MFHPEARWLCRREVRGLFVSLLAATMLACAPTVSRIGELNALGFAVRGPTPDNWIVVEPRDRAYRFMLPDVPRADRTSAQTIFELRYPDHAYLVNVWELGSRRGTPAHELEGTRDAYVRGLRATIERETETTHAGLPARDLVLALVSHDYEQNAFVRLVDGGDRIFGLAFLQVAGQGGSAEDVERLRRSLTIVPRSERAVSAGPETNVRRNTSGGEVDD